MGEIYDIMNSNDNTKVGEIHYNDGEFNAKLTTSDSNYPRKLFGFKDVNLFGIKNVNNFSEVADNVRVKWWLSSRIWRELDFYSKLGLVDLDYWEVTKELEGKCCRDPFYLRKVEAMH